MLLNHSILQQLSRIILLVTATGLLAACNQTGTGNQAATTAVAPQPSAFDLAVSKDGKIQVPYVDYRKDWSQVGVNAVAGPDGKTIAQLHIVYAEPAVVEAYRKTGQFPDGAVLIKELQSAKSGDLTTGHVTWSGDVLGWFVMIKDRKNRFPNNPLWAEGWGWAQFDADKPTLTKTSAFASDCQSCHEPAKAKDWVYVDDYPNLRAAALHR